jgi:PAS domain S-box-containing protein
MRVLIVDDHEVVRRGVRSLLCGQPNCDVCGEAVDGRDAIEKARQLVPDVIIMDVSMPRLNGLEATRQLRDILPHSEVLILSQHESAEMARHVFKAGARGYVVKSSIGRDLLQALEKVNHGETFIDPAISAVLSRSSHIDAQEIIQRSAAREKALSDSEELYRTTFSLAPVGVAHLAPDGRWLRVNPKFCEIIGYTQEELLRLTHCDVTHPDNLAASATKTGEIIAGLSDAYSMEMQYVRKDKLPVWVNVTVSAVRDADRTLKYFVAVVADTSKGKDVQQPLFKFAPIQTID